MNLVSRDERKKLGVFRFVKSFKYSLEGLAYAIRREQSIIVMTAFMFLAVSSGFFFKISILEWLFVLISIGLVIGTELINTAIEATIDLVSPKYHELAKIAKDTAAAAVFVYSIVAFIIGCLVFVPKVIDFVERVIL
jgi:diacylglycerol kinase